MRPPDEILHRLLDRTDPESTRLLSNPFWPMIEVLAMAVFGPLASFAFGKVRGEFLDRNYIKFFREHAAREELRDFVEQQHTSATLPFLQLYAHPETSKTDHILAYNNFPLPALIGEGGRKNVALLGNVGSGKTTLVAYAAANLEDDVYVLADNLAQCKTEEQILSDIYTSLPEQLGRLILEAGTEAGMSPREIQTELFENELKLADALTSKDDNDIDVMQKEQRRSHIVLKLMDYKVSRGRDAQLFMRPAIQFLKSRGKKVCIILDDIDRVDSDKVAAVARDEAIFLADILDCLVMISARESTVRKGFDVYGFEHVYHLCAPHFTDVLRRRLQTFTEELSAYPVEEVYFEDVKFGVDECLRVLESLVKSLLDDKVNSYVIHMLSNGSIAMMLDYFRTMLASPHLSVSDLKALANGRPIREHKLLESLLLYVYKKINPFNSYLLNLYNCGYPSMGMAFNALFRLRILQCLRVDGKVEKGLRILEYSELRKHLELLGWETEAERVLEGELRQLESYGLVEVMEFGKRYRDGNSRIMLQDAGYLYADHLCSSYRYLQTIIPDCWLDYEVDDFALTGELPQVDAEIERFIAFISRCEDVEMAQMGESGKRLIAYLQQGGTLSDILTNEFQAERSRQQGHFS
jgi:AAA ATPase domain